MNPERDEEIRRLYATSELSQREIGERFGITESRVCQLLQRTGFSGRDRLAVRRRLREATAARERERREAERTRRDNWLTEMWRAGASTKDIGEILGMDPSIVGRRAKALGLPQRRRGGWGSSRKSWRSEETSGMPSAVRDTRAEAELRVTINRAAQTCCCGRSAPSEQCGWCAQRLCDECAHMTPQGVRCTGCIAA